MTSCPCTGTPPCWVCEDELAAEFDRQHGLDLPREERSKRARDLSVGAPVISRVHNHLPWRPMCNERVVDGQLRGACLNDDGSDKEPADD